MPPAQKILIRSPNWVGDAVMATPVPRALKRTQPGCRVHVLAPRWAAPVWEQHPDVDRIILANPEGRGGWRTWPGLVLALRRERYDLALILPNSFSSAWLAFWAGAQQRVGYAGQQRGWLLTQRVAPFGSEAHIARPQAYLTLARRAGADVDLTQEWIFTLRTSSEERARAEELLAPLGSGLRIGLAPGSVAPSRRWPVERFAELGDRLAAAGRQVLLVGSRADEPAARAVAEKMRKQPLNLAGRTSLREAIAVIRGLDLLVSNDSGSMHLAYAQGVPVLVLQGAADARVTGPFGAGSCALRADHVACAPCVRNDCPRQDLACMTGISVDAVWKAVTEMLVEKKAKS
jgi:heptosyltransferase II